MSAAQDPEVTGGRFTMTRLAGDSRRLEAVIEVKGPAGGRPTPAMIETATRAATDRLKSEVAGYTALGLERVPDSDFGHRIEKPVRNTVEMSVGCVVRPLAAA